MGDKNQLLFLQASNIHVTGPVLEIGSKDYGSTQNFRSLFSQNRYVGIDLEAGNGVDHVVDLTQPPQHDILPSESFELIISCSVLEHVKKPWLMAEYITSLVKSTGYIYIAVPWVWRYHPYPDDYFRFSPHAIRELFPNFVFIRSAYSTNIIGEFFDINKKVEGVDNAMAMMKIVAHGQRKYLPYLQVHMLGQKSK